MAYFDIVNKLKIAVHKKVCDLHNIAWILNCVPLEKEHEKQLFSELDTMSKKRGIKYHLSNGFVMLEIES